jgi:hypothetical protein
MHVLLAAHQTASTAVLPVVTLFMSFVLATPKLRRLCKYVASACIWRWYVSDLLACCETVELCDHRVLHCKPYLAAVGRVHFLMSPKFDTWALHRRITS